LVALSVVTWWRFQPETGGHLVAQTYRSYR
jgi:hypothetical protein